MPPLTIRAPARLHFGLLSFGRSEGRQFGGAGVLVDIPGGLCLTCEPSIELEARGLARERVIEFAKRYAKRNLGNDVPSCRITVHSLPPEHVGLGTGTQLGLAVAAAIHVTRETASRGQGAGNRSPVILHPSSFLSPNHLAQSVGRGLRSAVGTYGFFYGGLIAEPGKLANDVISPLGRRVELPLDWRFVLIRPRGTRGLSGTDEFAAFERLPPVPEEVARNLESEMSARLLPAAERGDFATFSESLYEFGKLAGDCFALLLGGPYATPRLGELVAMIRGEGVLGVGQSSWGPTLFALVQNPNEATWLVRVLRDRDPERSLAITVGLPNRTGATLWAH